MREKKTFEEVVRPVMEWLAKNRHPNTKIVVESDRAQIVEVQFCYLSQDYIEG